jgi:hypothetical protein
MRRILITAAIAVLATPAFAGTLVLDNFDTKNPTFATDYVYTPSGNTAANQYNVAKDGYPWNPNFFDFGDTTGTGNYMIVNGSTQEGAVVWSNITPIHLIAGNYNFVFALADVCCKPSINGGVDLSPPSLVVKSGQMVIGTSAATISDTGHWHTFTENFSVSSAGPLTFSIIDTNRQPEGNDFGLDDIRLTGSGIPEPASWALMLVGFGGLGAALRSRRRGAVATA